MASAEHALACAITGGTRLPEEVERLLQRAASSVSLIPAEPLPLSDELLAENVHRGMGELLYYARALSTRRGVHVDELLEEEAERWR